jgi:lauroyl/myristoyl acyltransferase
MRGFPVRMILLTPCFSFVICRGSLRTRLLSLNRFMDYLLYLIVKSLVVFLQTLPLRWGAQLGRLGGDLVYRLDRRHRRMAVRNLTAVFGGQKSESEIVALARENFRRLGENYCSAIKTASMSAEALAPHLKMVGFEKIQDLETVQKSWVAAVGHFGNFELYARIGWPGSDFQVATTFRSLKQKRLNQLLQDLRARSKAMYFERREEVKELREAIKVRNMAVGFLSDQHAGQSSIRIPFLGHECSTTVATAVFALRYRLPLVSAICYRTGLAQWEIEFNDWIPTRENGKARSVEAIMGDVNEALGRGVLRDPANWFWVHNRWRFLSRAELRGKSPVAAPASV